MAGTPRYGAFEKDTREKTVDGRPRPFDVIEKLLRGLGYFAANLLSGFVFGVVGLEKVNHEKNCLAF